ncbi:MAG TPA: NUDIX hydrolase [Candidatus Paceibacterota bacterium]
MQKQNPPKVKEKRVVFESAKFRLLEKDMEFANGDTEIWEVVEMKGNGGVRVLAITEKRELIFVQEYRGAAEKYVIRFPTGLIEPGEEPRRAAARELQEETGFVAETLESLGTLESTSGYYKGHTLYVFVGKNLKQTGQMAREPGEEDMEILYIPLEKAFQMAEQAEFEDAQTVYTILRLKRFLFRG